MTATFAHEIVGLTNDAQIATLMNAVLSHVPDLELGADPNYDPTVIGIREKHKPDADFVMHKFELDGGSRRAPKVVGGQQMQPSTSSFNTGAGVVKPTPNTNLVRVKFYFDENARIRVNYNC